MVMQNVAVLRSLWLLISPLCYLCSQSSPIYSRSTLHTYAKLPTTLKYNMIKPLAPILTPVTFRFLDGAELCTSIDPQSRIHLYTCNICGKGIKSGKQGKPQTMVEHKKSQGNLFPSRNSKEKTKSPVCLCQ